MSISSSSSRARLEQLWRRVPRYKPLSVGVVLLDLVPAGRHQPDLFAADNHRRQKLSPLIDRINDRYGRCSIGFHPLCIPASQPPTDPARTLRLENN
jgi:hypothetical protein